MNELSRRGFLLSSAAAGVGLIAGCVSATERNQANEMRASALSGAQSARRKLEGSKIIRKVNF